MSTSVRLFTSYAQVDRHWSEDFVKRLQLETGASRNYRYELWQDTEIAVGERWFNAIQQAIGACDLGLLLISPGFLGSPFIGEHELPRFIGESPKPIVPVLLRPVSFTRHNLKGLEAYQIFQLDRQKAFSDCAKGPTRDRFVQQLFEQIEHRLDRIVTSDG